MPVAWHDCPWRRVGGVGLIASSASSCILAKNEFNRRSISGCSKSGLGSMGCPRGSRASITSLLIK